MKGWSYFDREGADSIRDGKQGGQDNELNDKAIR